MAIRLTDFDFLELSGTTHGTADTSRLQYHHKDKVPQFWIALEGEVYIPVGGLAAKYVDVRSRLTSQSYRILLFF